MAEENTKPADNNVQAVNVQGSQSADVNVSMDDAAKAAPTDGPTAETLGVSNEQFDKYFKDGNYNWEAHAKELQFAQQQKDNKSSEQAEANKAEPKAEDKSSETPEGIDWEGLGTKIGNGTFGETEKAELAKLGIPEQIVDEYVDVIKQNVDMHFNQVQAAFGGEKAMEEMINWANGNMSEKDMDVLEDALADPNKFRMAVDSLKARAGLPVGTPNANLGGNANQVQPYQTQAEMLADQRNPKYKTDPSFREQVWARAGASNFEGSKHTL